jgi:hypothetical protein
VISGLRTEPRWTRQTQTRGLGCLRITGR